MPSTTALRRLALAVACAAASGAAAAANLPLAARGPLSPVHPFPLWYQDASGVQVEPCLQATGCVLPATGVSGGFSTALPVRYPDNFPSTLVYGYVNVDVPVFDQSTGRVEQKGLAYTAQLIAQFGGPSGLDPVIWTEISFVTLGPGQFPAGQTYTIEHPYGTFVLASDAAGNLCSNRFQGGRNPCVIRFPAAPAAGTPFDGVLAANPSADPNDATLGTFVSQVGAPAGFLGDGATRSGITGSPAGHDFIRISGPGVGTSAGLGCTNGVATDCIEVGGANPPKGSGFVVAGKRFVAAGGPTTQFWITDPASAAPAGTLPRRDFTAVAGAPLTLTIRAVDVNGNLTASYGGNVALSSSDPGAALPAVVTLTNGVGTFSFTPHQATAPAVASTVSATDGVRTGRAVGLVNGGPATALLLAQTSAAVAGRPASFTLRAIDAFGNVDGSFVGTASVTSTDPAATLPASVSLVLGQGAFTATFRTAGDVQVTADGGPLLVPGGATAAVAPGPAASLALSSGGDQSGEVGAPLPSALAVVVKDAFGNGVPGVPVTFAPPAAGGSVSAPTATTDAAGLASSTGTLPTVPGAYVFTATAGALAGAPVTFAAAAVHGPPAALAMTGPATATAGVSVPVALALADRFGNPCTASAASVAFTTADPAGPPPLAAIAGGVGTVAVTFHRAGPATLGGALVGAPTVSAAYATAVGPGPAAGLSATGLPATLAAGVTATLAVTALDAFQNVATGTSTPLTVTSSDASAVLPTGVAIAGGVATAQVAFRTTGAHTVTFTSAGGLSATASAIVTPAALASITSVSAPSSAAVGGAAGLATFEVRDTLGNPVPGKLVTFAAPSGGSVSPATATTDAAGRAATAVTLATTAGTYPFTATVGTFTATVSVTASPGPADHLTLTAAATPTPVLDCGCYDLVAQLRDGFGNGVPSALGGIAASASAAATVVTTDLVASLPAPTASLTGGALQPDGSAHLHVCDALPERATVTVSAPGATPAVALATLDLAWTLGPADPAKTAALHLLTIDHATLVAWSGRGHVSFKPMSACGNPIGPGQPVTFAVAGPGSLTPAFDVGDGSYTATLDVAPCPASGATQVVARVGGADIASLPVAVTCVPPDLVTSTVSFSRRDVTMCNDPQRDLVTVAVTPRDASGQLLGTGNTVALAMDGLLGGAVRDGGDGTYTTTFSAAACAAGARQATVSVDGVDLASAAFTFTCSPVVAAASGVHVSGKAVADGASSLGVVVAATNDCGEPAAGRPVALTTTVGALAAASGVTDAAGTFTTAVTATAAGQGTVTATVDGVALAPAPLAFEPKPRSGGCGTGADGGLLSLAALLAAARRRRPMRR